MDLPHRKAPNSRRSDEEHTPEAIRARLGSPAPPSLIRDAVLGAIDGCVTTFAVVAGATGGNISGRVILILGFSNLIADGFSMAASNYLGAKSLDEELEKAETDELGQIDNAPEGEREEVRQIFAAKGIQGDLLEKVTSIVTGNRTIWMRTMITEELGLRIGKARPLRAGTATFAAFILAGSIPLSAFIVPSLSPGIRFTASCLATTTAFIAIGLLKGRILRRPLVNSALQTLILGGSAAGLAYVAGFLISHFLGVR